MIPHFLRRCRALPLVLALFALSADGSLALQPAPIASSLSAEDVIERARAAVQSNLKAAVRCEGAAIRTGVKGGYTLTSTPDGRYRLEISGTLREATGFDGNVTWETDWSDMPRRLMLGDDERAALPVWVASGTWLAKERRLRILTAEDQKESDAVVMTVDRGENGTKARVGLSTATWLPAWLEITGEAGVERWDFRDYGGTGGVVFPMRMTAKRGGQENTYTIESATVLQKVDPKSFDQPKWDGRDTAFSAGAPAVIESRRTPTGHIFVRPKLNGKDVGWFFLDSGAGAMCISPQAAEELGMKQVGEILAVGVGAAVKTKLRRGAELELGPIKVRDLTYVELDLAGLERIMGFKIGGICGYDIFARSVVEFQPNTGFVAFYDPAAYKLSKGKWQELLMTDKSAAVLCSFPGGKDLPFRLDTGAGSTVAFHTPAVKKWNLLEGRETTPSLNGGVGGAQAARTGPIDWFEIAGHRFEKPVVSFSLAQRGAFTSADTVGNIGQKFMEPFTLVFDYPHRRIAFVKRESAEP